MHRERVRDFGVPERERTGRTGQKSGVHGVGRGVLARHVDTDRVAAGCGRGRAGKRNKTIVEPVARAEELHETVDDQRHAFTEHDVLVCR